MAAGETDRIESLLVDAARFLAHALEGLPREGQDEAILEMLSRGHTIKQIVVKSQRAIRARSRAGADSLRFDDAVAIAYEEVYRGGALAAFEAHAHTTQRELKDRIWNALEFAVDNSLGGEVGVDIAVMAFVVDLVNRLLGSPSELPPQWWYPLILGYDNKRDVFQHVAAQSLWILGRRHAEIEDVITASRRAVDATARADRAQIRRLTAPLRRLTAPLRRADAPKS